MTKTPLSASPSLADLLAVHSQAGDSILRYYDILECELSKNPLLAKFGRKLDDLRIPLYCEAFIADEDLDRARIREELRGKGDIRTGGSQLREDRFYSARSHLETTDVSNDRTNSKPLPEPISGAVLGLEMALIAGDPGSGKTEWVKNLARDVASADRKKLDDHKILPEETCPALSVRLPAVAQRLRKPAVLRKFLKTHVGVKCDALDDGFEKTLAAILLAAHQTLGLDGWALRHVWNLYSASQHDLPGRPGLVCLDAWDEVPRALRDETRKAIHGFAERVPARVVATSRAAGYDANLLPIPRGFEPQKKARRRELRLLDFRPEDTTAFFERFFAKDRAIGQRLIAELRTKPTISGMVANPLIATLIGIVFGPSQAGGRGLALPARRHEVYRAVLEELLGASEEARKDHAADPTVKDDKLEVLSAIAFRFFPDEFLSVGEVNGFIDDFLGSRSRTAKRQNLREHIRQRKHRDLPEVFARDDAIFSACEGARDRGYLFLHLTVQEHLAASWIAQVVNEAEAAHPGEGWGRAEVDMAPDHKRPARRVRVCDLIDRKSEDWRWREVLVLLAGQLTNADPMLVLVASGSQLDENSHSVRVHDAWHTRLCLAAACMAETSPKSTDDTERGICSEITEQVMNLWHRSGWRRASDPKAGGLLAIRNAHCRGIRILDRVFGRLQSSDPKHAIWAMWWIREIGPAVTAEILEALPRWFGDEQVAYHAGQALAGIGPVAATGPILEALPLLLKNRQAHHYPLEAVRSLGSLAITDAFIASLVQMLSDDRLDVQWAAVNALRKLGAAAATGPLLAALEILSGHPTQGVRWITPKAIYSLGAPAATPSILSALSRLLTDEEYHVRYSAAEGIGCLGAGAATEPILGTLIRLLNDERSDVQWPALVALSRIDPAVGSRQFLESLASLLTDRRKNIRLAGLQAIGRLGATAAKDPVFESIVPLLTDADDAVRQEAASATARLGPAAATAPILNGITQLLSDDKKDVRDAAADAIASLGTAAATGAILDGITRLLADRDRYVRKAAAGAVGGLGAAAATLAILRGIARLLADEHSDVRQAAADAVGGLGAAAATESFLLDLLHLFEDEREGVRRSAIEAVRKLDTAVASRAFIQALLRLWTDHRDSVRYTATEAARFYRPLIPTGPILESLARLLADPNSEVRSSAASVVCKFGPAAANEAILAAFPRLLVDDSYYVRGAAKDVGKLGSEAATEPILATLAGMLLDDDSDMHRDAADAISGLGAAAATQPILSALAGMLAHNKESERRRAGDALSTLKHHLTPAFFDALCAALNNAPPESLDEIIFDIMDVGLAVRFFLIPGELSRWTWRRIEDLCDGP